MQFNENEMRIYIAQIISIEFLSYIQIEDPYLDMFLVSIIVPLSSELLSPSTHHIKFNPHQDARGMKTRGKDYFRNISRDTSIMKPLPLPICQLLLNIFIVFSQIEVERKCFWSMQLKDKLTLNWMEFGRLEFFTGKIVNPFPDLSCSALLKSFRIATLSATATLKTLKIKKMQKRLLISGARGRRISEML